jgi:hypothetical protein
MTELFLRCHWNQEEGHNPTDHWVKESLTRIYLMGCPASYSNRGLIDDTVDDNDYSYVEVMIQEL